MRENISCGSDQLLMNIHYPEQRTSPVPAVIFVTAFADAGFEKVTGTRLSRLPAYRSWAALVAASGMAGVVYSAVDAARDVLTLIEYLRSNGEALGMDPGKLAIWSCSSNVPNALNVLQVENSIRCAVLCYGFMLDLPGSTVIDEAAKQYRFAHPLAGKPFPKQLPATLLVRAGKDEFTGINRVMDQFVAQALANNFELELINYPQGIHAFDILDDSAASVQIIKRILSYLRQRLGLRAIDLG